MVLICGTPKDLFFRGMTFTLSLYQRVFQTFLCGLHIWNPTLKSLPSSKSKNTADMQKNAYTHTHAYVRIDVCQHMHVRACLHAHAHTHSHIWIIHLCPCQLPIIIRTLLYTIADSCTASQLCMVLTVKEFDTYVQHSRQTALHWHTESCTSQRKRERSDSHILQNRTLSVGQKAA